MKYSSRLWLYGPFAVLALIAIAVCANWYFTVNALAEKFASLNGREAVPGVTLRFSPPEMRGFPFRIDAVFRDFRVTVQDKDSPIEWRAENFALHRMAYGSQSLFEAAGQQTMSWTDDKGEKQSLTFTPGRMQASVLDDKEGRPTRFDLDIIGIASPELKGERFQFHIRRDPNAALLNVVVKSQRLSTSPVLDALLGRFGRNFKGDVTKAESFDGLRAGTMSWVDAQGAWRAAGGEIHTTK